MGHDTTHVLRLRSGSHCSQIFHGLNVMESEEYSGDLENKGSQKQEFLHQQDPIAEVQQPLPNSLFWASKPTGTQREPLGKPKHGSVSQSLTMSCDVCYILHNI